MVEPTVRRVFSVTQILYQSAVVKKEPKCKALDLLVKLCSYTLNGLELWVITKRIRSQIEAEETSFLHRVAGRSLKLCTHQVCAFKNGLSMGF